MTGYYDRKGNALTMEQMAATFEDRDGRRVARTDIGEGVDVSTVHLVLDHQYGDGPPLIFETMIFGGEHDQDCWRYSTEEQANAGHEAVVAWLRGKGPEPTDG
jgi:hypothetical protein